MIHSRSEFEAVLGDVIRMLDKVIYARGSDLKLEKARRQLEAVEQSLKKKQTPEAEQVQGLREAASAIRTQRLNFQGLEDKTYDLEDYLEFNPTAGFDPPDDEKNETD